ncbi:MAG: DUF433 domain-containing protein [Bacteroidota bacterium]
MDTQKVGQWIRRYWEKHFLEDYSEVKIFYTEGEGRERVFNFYTLIELITISAFRELEVSFHKIKKAHKIAAEVLETPYPFAKRGFMTDGKKIFHNRDEVSSLRLEEAKQLEFRKLIEPYCEKIDFDEVTELAQRYWPLGRDHHVVIDPQHRFGEPTIAGTNISASMINNLIEAGEPIEFIAEEYNISEQAIRDVREYYKKAA